MLEHNEREAFLELLGGEPQVPAAEQVEEGDGTVALAAPRLVLIARGTVDRGAIPRGQVVEEHDEVDGQRERHVQDELKQRCRGR